MGFYDARPSEEDSDNSVPESWLKVGHLDT